jgi:hypothetical protein
MTFTEKDFTKCHFNPFDPDLLEKAADLIINLSDERVFKYIIAVYDPSSPLIKSLPDLEARRLRACEIFGIEPTEDFKKGVFDFQDDTVSDAVDVYLRKYVQSRLWAMIVSTEFTFWEFADRLRRPVQSTILGGKDKEELQAVEIKTKLRQSMDEMNAALENYYSKFYQDDKQLEEVVKKKRFRPETFGKRNAE